MAAGLRLDRAQAVDGLVAVFDADGLRTTVNSAMLCRWEHGKITPGPDYVTALVALYDASAAQLGLTTPELRPAVRPVSLHVADQPGPWVAAEEGTDKNTDDMNRRSFTAAIAALAVGGPLGEPIHRALSSLGQPNAPVHVGVAEVVQVEQAEAMFTTWDLRFGGGAAREMAGRQLRWATSLLDAQMSSTVGDRLHSAVGSLAERVAWSSFDAGQQEPARALFRVALYAATTAEDADLRAHILSDVATQQLYLGHPDECLKVIRLAEGDERIRPGVRMVLHGVKARAFGAVADAHACRREIGLAEEAYTHVDPGDTPAWMTSFLNEPHVYSVTGQAAYLLARARGEFSDDAHQRLTAAIDGFDQTRARAIALCSTRLATLHLRAGHTAEGTHAVHTALQAVPGLRSARIIRDLTTMRAAAETCGDDGQALSSAISAALAPAV